MTYKTRGNRLVNEVTLGDGYPLSDNLQPLKIGGEASILQISSPTPSTTNKGKVKVEGDLEVTGSLLKQPTLHVLNGGVYNSGTSKFYLPLVGYNIEYTSNTSRNENVAFVPPYDGKVKKLLLRSETFARSTTAGFHISTAETEVPNATAVEEVTQDLTPDDVTFTFDFTNASSFNAGDIIAVSVDPTNAVHDMVWTLVLEYYID